MVFLKEYIGVVDVSEIIAHGLKGLNICLFLLQQITEGKLLCCTGVTDNPTRGESGGRGGGISVEFEAGQYVVVHWIRQMIQKVLVGSYSSHQSLYKVTQYCQHSQPSILNFLQLQLLE